MLHSVCRHLSAGCLWLVSLSTLSFAQTATLSLASGSALPGGTVSLNLILSGGTQPAALQWTFTYAPADFTSVSVVAGPASSTAGKIVDCQGGSGTYNCLLTGINTSTLGDGSVATATFTLSTSINMSRPIQLMG